MDEPASGDAQGTGSDETTNDGFATDDGSATSDEVTAATGGEDAEVLDIETIENAFTGSGGPEAALERVRLVAHLLDEAVRIPGTDFRVGLDPILGILPGAGDAVAAALSLYPVAEAYRLGAPTETLVKMLALVAADFTVGSVPVLGTIFDAFWKANEWNVRIIEDLVENA